MSFKYIVLVLFVYLLIQPFKVYAVNKESDPTKPTRFNAPSEEQSSLEREGVRVEAVIKREGKFFAIVNGKNVNLGETVNGWELVEINSSYVSMKQVGDLQHAVLKFRVSEQINVKSQVGF